MRRDGVGERCRSGGDLARVRLLPFSRRVWQTADGLPEDFAQALAQTPDGYLWIGTSGGLVRFDGIRFTIFNSRDTSPPSATIASTRC